MRISIIIIFCTFCNLLCAQFNNFNKLKKEFDQYKSEEKYDSALIMAKEMKYCALKNEGDSSNNYALSYYYLTYCNEKLKNTDSTLYFYKQSYLLLKKHDKRYQPEFAKTIKFIADYHYDEADYKKSESLYLELLEISKKEFGENHVELASILNNLGNLYYNMSEYSTALPYYSKASEIYKSTFGESHSDYAMSLNNLAALYYDMGEYKTAEKKYSDALEILKNKTGDEELYATILNNLGNLFSDIGDYKKAEPLYQHVLKLRKKLNGEEHPTYADILNNLGTFYLEINEFKLAEDYYKKAYQIYKKTLGEEHPDFARTLKNIGYLYFNIGDYKSAEKSFKNVLDIRKKVLGENHSSYASSLHSIGDLYMENGEFKNALDVYMQTAEIRRKLLGTEHPDYAAIMNSLGNYFLKTEDFSSAETYYKKAMSIFKSAYGENNIDYAMSLKNLGYLSSAIKSYSTAESYYKQALQIYENNFSTEHQMYLSLLNEYAINLGFSGKEREAFEILKKTLLKKNKEITNSFEWLSDNQKESYWKKESHFYDKLAVFSNRAYSNVPEIAGLNYDAALAAKSKLLESKISSENYFREIEEIRAELAYRRRLLIKMESEGTSEPDKIEKLRSEADSLDKRLTLSWPEYAQQKKNLSITWEQVRQNLDANEAAIEFVRFYDESDSTYHYNALVLKKNDKIPVLIQLCIEDSLKKLIDKMDFKGFNKLIWQPMETVLKDVKIIYYSPVAELNRVPFAAIQLNNQNEYLLDKVSLYQLTSTRYLAIDLKKKAKETITKTIGMFGGVNYNYLPGKSEQVDNPKKEKSKKRSSDSAEGALAYLEGTKTEIDKISSLLSTFNWQVQSFEYNDAKEEVFIKMEGAESKGILHLATHGYAFPEYDFNDKNENTKSLRYNYRLSQNPMVRSGLILTGGNWAWTGSDTLSKLGMEQNGILTALEVSQLNLRKTKLVVLSACETGLGKIEGSEGTFGLKRGFKLAGVEQMIVSLWSVPDKETMELMTLFYNDLSINLNPIISFEKAQKEMRKRYPDEPEKWAGFVLVR